MSRPFSIALIILGTAIIGSLIWLHFHLMGRQHRAFFSNSTDIVEVTIEQKMRTLDFSLRLTEGRLAEDWQRERYIELINLLKQSQIVRNQLNEQVLSRKLNIDNKAAKFQALEHLVQNCARELMNLKESTLTLLADKQSDYDLSQFQVDELVKKINMTALAFQVTKVNTLLAKQSNLEFHLCFLSFLNIQEEIFHNLIQITGSKADYIDAFFPVVFGSPQYPKVGKTHLINVRIGSYDRRLPRTEKVLIVGTDTLLIGPDGTADYSIIPSRKGLYSLPTKCIVTNPLSGEVKVGTGKYDFNVY